MGGGGMSAAPTLKKALTAATHVWACWNQYSIFGYWLALKVVPHFSIQ